MTSGLKHTPPYILALLTSASAFVATGCGSEVLTAPADDGAVGQSADALVTVGANAQVANTWTTDPSVAIVDSGTFQTATMVWTDNTAQFGRANWGFSTNWTGGTPTWTTFNNPFQAWGAPPERPTISEYSGTPTHVITTNATGQTLLLTTADDGNPATDIVSVVSTTSGQTYATPRLITSVAAGGVDSGGAIGFFDVTQLKTDTPAVGDPIWVVWQEAASKKWWTRRLTIAPGSTAWASASTPVQLPNLPSLSVGPLKFSIQVTKLGQNELLHVITALKSDLFSCPSTAVTTQSWMYTQYLFQAGSFSVAPGIVVQSPVTTDTAWPECVGAGFSGNSAFLHNDAYPAYTIDATTGKCLAAITVSGPQGTRVKLLFTTDGTNWSPVASWPSITTPNRRDQWDPAVVCNRRPGFPAGALGFVFYDNRADSSGNIKTAVFGNFTSDDGTSWENAEVTTGSGVPFTFLAGPGKPAIGVSHSTGQYLGAWGDNRAAQAQPRIEAAGITKN